MSHHLTILPLDSLRLDVRILSDEARPKTEDQVRLINLETGWALPLFLTLHLYVHVHVDWQRNCSQRRWKRLS
jgi:hypothetical protein